MGKILRRIKIEGKDTVVLFDTGALHNFILRTLIPKDAVFIENSPPSEAYVGPIKVRIDGWYLLEVKIDNKKFGTIFVPVDDLGYDIDTKSDRVKLEAIIGVIGMEQAGIVLDPSSGKIH